MTEIENAEQLKGLGACYRDLKAKLTEMEVEAGRGRAVAAAHLDVAEVTYYDTKLQLLDRFLRILEEEFVEFKPFEPLPVNEKGESYFPPDTKGIVVANLEVRNPGEKRLGPEIFGEDPEC